MVVRCDVVRKRVVARIRQFDTIAVRACVILREPVVVARIPEIDPLVVVRGDIIGECVVVRRVQADAVIVVRCVVPGDVAVICIVEVHPGCPVTVYCTTHRKP